MSEGTTETLSKQCEPLTYLPKDSHDGIGSDPPQESELLIPWSELSNADASNHLSRSFADWVLPVFRQCSSTTAQDCFPCLFAKKAGALQSGRFFFVDSLETESGQEAVWQAILAYYGVLKRYPRSRATFMPLIVAVKPVHPLLSLQEYHAQAWALLQYLHEHDPEPWPFDVPRDPERGDWSFCFAGQQLFANVSCPAHRHRRSRNLGDALFFIMQPRTNFDIVAGNNSKGRLVREEIQRRIERYDGRPPSADLGYFGTSENREWKQMAVRDADEAYPERCPLKIRPE